MAREILRLRTKVALARQEQRDALARVTAQLTEARVRVSESTEQVASQHRGRQRAVRALRAERDAVKRHRDDLLALIERDVEILRGYGVQETTTGDAIHVLGRQRDSLRTELEALRGRTGCCAECEHDSLLAEIDCWRRLPWWRRAWRALRGRM